MSPDDPLSLPPAMQKALKGVQAELGRVAQQAARMTDTEDRLRAFVADAFAQLKRDVSEDNAAQLTDFRKAMQTTLNGYYTLMTGIQKRMDEDDKLRIERQLGHDRQNRAATRWRIALAALVVFLIVINLLVLAFLFGRIGTLLPPG